MSLGVQLIYAWEFNKTVKCDFYIFTVCNDLSVAFFLDVVTIHIPGILGKGSFPVYVEIITVRQTI